ncbi:hypothetical protein HHI36_008083 [Cryptolaemus montrouzieri]|uniref:Uncharacterized protein n=1 Tax=Cryptolaemus montrouzieri TaxID=559131 RepID=A0ABD2MRI3_9CUCU
MSRLNPNHLKSTEFSYELALRNVDSPATVDEKRKHLRGIIAQENSDRSFIEISDSHEFKDNVKKLKESIADITTLVSIFQGNSNSEYSACQLKMREADLDEKLIVPTTPPVIANPVNSFTPFFESSVDIRKKSSCLQMGDQEVFG